MTVLLFLLFWLSIISSRKIHILTFGGGLNNTHHLKKKAINMALREKAKINTCHHYESTSWIRGEIEALRLTKTSNGEHNLYPVFSISGDLIIPII